MCCFSCSGSPVIVNGDEFENIEMVGGVPPRDDGSYPGPQGVKQPSQPVQDVNRNISSGQKCDIIITNPTEEHRHHHQGHQSHHGPPSHHGGQHPLHLTSPSSMDRDVMLELVKNKGLMKTKMDQRMSSIDSDMSEASTLKSVASDKALDEKGRGRSRINHHTLRGFVSDSETESVSVCCHFISPPMSFTISPQSM